MSELTDRPAEPVTPTPAEPREPDDLDLFLAEQLKDPEFAEAWRRQELKDWRAAYERGRERGKAEGIAEEHARFVAALDAATRGAYADGLGDGRRQATEGWEREWLVETSQWWTSGVVPEADARKIHAQHGGKLTSRLVGPWEPAPVTDAREASPSVDGGTSG